MRLAVSFVNAWMLSMLAVTGHVAIAINRVGLRAVQDVHLFNRTVVWTVLAFLAATFPGTEARSDLVVLPVAYDAGQEPIRLAIKAVREQRWSDARSALKEYCQSTSDTPHAEIVLAELLLKMGMSTDTRRILDALSLTSCDPFELHLAYCQLAVAEKRWFDGWTHAQQADGLSPPGRWSKDRRQQSLSDLKLLTAVCCEGRADWSGVVTSLEPLVQAEATPQVWLRFGKGCFHLGRVTEARRALDEYCQKTDSANSSELLLAQWFEGAGKPSEAEKWFLRAVKNNDQRRREKAQLGYARFLLWNNRSTEMSPWLVGQWEDPADQQEQRYLTALQLRMQHDFAGARAILAKLHQEHAESFAISNQLALVFIESDDDAERSLALRLAHANVRSHTTLPEAWSTLGWIQFRLGDTTSAEQNLATASRYGTPPRDAAAYMAEVQQRLGQSELAERLRAAAQSAIGPRFVSNLATAETQTPSP